MSEFDIQMEKAYQAQVRRVEEAKRAKQKRGGQK